MGTIQELLPKYLHTERLTLERWDINNPVHMSKVLEAMNSKTTLERMGDTGVRTPEDMRNYVNQCVLHGDRFKGGVADDVACYVARVGVQAPEGTIAGFASMCQRVVATAHGREFLPPDIGWIFLEPEMGKGYATEAAREVLRYFTEDFGQKDIIVFPNEHNRPSNRVAEKLGFVDGGSCPDLDAPGRMMNIWMLPHMQKVDVLLKDGISFKLQ